MDHAGSNDPISWIVQCNLFVFCSQLGKCLDPIEVCWHKIPLSDIFSDGKNLCLSDNQWLDQLFHCWFGQCQKLWRKLWGVLLLSNPCLMEQIWVRKICWKCNKCQQDVPSCFQIVAECHNQSNNVRLFRLQIFVVETAKLSVGKMAAVSVLDKRLSVLGDDLEENTTERNPRDPCSFGVIQVLLPCSDVVMKKVGKMKRIWALNSAAELQRMLSWCDRLSLLGLGGSVKKFWCSLWIEWTVVFNRRGQKKQHTRAELRQRLVSRVPCPVGISDHSNHRVHVSQHSGFIVKVQGNRHRVSLCWLWWVGDTKPLLFLFWNHLLFFWQEFEGTIVTIQTVISWQDISVLELTGKWHVTQLGSSRCTECQIQQRFCFCPGGRKQPTQQVPLFFQSESEKQTKLPLICCSSHFLRSDSALWFDGSHLFPGNSRLPVKKIELVTFRPKIHTNADVGIKSKLPDQNTFVTTAFICLWVTRNQATLNQSNAVQHIGKRWRAQSRKERRNHKQQHKWRLSLLAVGRRFADARRLGPAQNDKALSVDVPCQAPDTEHKNNASVFSSRPKQTATSRHRAVSATEGTAQCACLAWFCQFNARRSGPDTENEQCVSVLACCACPNLSITWSIFLVSERTKLERLHILKNRSFCLSSSTTTGKLTGLPCCNRFRNFFSSVSMTRSPFSEDEVDMSTIREMCVSQKGQMSGSFEECSLFGTSSWFMGVSVGGTHPSTGQGRQISELKRPCARTECCFWRQKWWSGNPATGFAISLSQCSTSQCLSSFAWTSSHISVFWVGVCLKICSQKRGTKGHSGRSRKQCFTSSVQKQRFFLSPHPHKPVGRILLLDFDLVCSVARLKPSDKTNWTKAKEKIGDSILVCVRLERQLRNLATLQHRQTATASNKLFLHCAITKMIWFWQDVFLIFTAKQKKTKNSTSGFPFDFLGVRKTFWNPWKQFVFSLSVMSQNSFENKLLESLAQILPKDGEQKILQWRKNYSLPVETMTSVVEAVVVLIVREQRKGTLKASEGRMVEILSSFSQDQRIYFCHVLCHFALVLTQGHKLTDLDLSNRLLQKGFGSLTNLNFSGLIDVSTKHQTAEKAQSLRLSFAHVHVQHFFAAIHLLNSPVMETMKFIRNNILIEDHGEPEKNKIISDSSMVVRFLFGLASTIFGECFDVLLQNILKFLTQQIKMDAPVVDSQVSLLILQCLFEAQEISLFRQVQTETFVRQIFSFHAQHIENNHEAIAHYLLNTTSAENKQSVWTVYCHRKNKAKTLLRKLDDLNVNFHLKTTNKVTPSDQERVVISNKNQDFLITVLAEVSTTETDRASGTQTCSNDGRGSVSLANPETTPDTSLSCVCTDPTSPFPLPSKTSDSFFGQFGFQTKDQFECNRSAQRKFFFNMVKDFVKPFFQMHCTTLVRCQYRKDDHIWFSFPTAMRHNFYECVEISPMVPMHWVKVCVTNMHNFSRDARICHKHSIFFVRFLSQTARQNWNKCSERSSSNHKRPWLKQQTKSQNWLSSIHVEWSVLKLFLQVGETLSDSQSVVLLNLIQEKTVLLAVIIFCLFIRQKEKLNGRR